MAQDKPLPDLSKRNASDRMAMAMRALLANIPIAGPALAELVSEVIPNQRDERLRKYVLQLAQRLDSLENAPLNFRSVHPEKIALFEDGAIGSSRATTDERIGHLVNLVAVGICGTNRFAEDQRSIVRLLNELTEADLRYLMLFTKRYGSDREWRKKNGFGWEDREQATTADEDIADTYVQGRLISMGLMRPTYELRRKYSARVRSRYDDVSDELDDFSVEWDSTEIEASGFALLRKLGFLGPEET